jgi:16S rRNA C967 or C1407 C5-methylase (RsmB/RsmF family)/NOL1/NOP2/fmu family ribosome biogenesis protein
MAEPGLPDSFVVRMRELLGPEAPAFLDSYRRPAERAVRANPLKLHPAVLPALLGIEPDPVPWCREAFFLPEGVRLGASVANAAGLCYLQEPSALAVGEALDIRPGQRVLDLAAAPGGKATLVAGRLGGDGVVVANEVQHRRLQALADNLDRWGSARTAIANETVERLAERLPQAFDRVLLDAPCSGEGLFRRSPPARAQWRPGHVRGSARRQRGLLAQAARLVRPGGVLVYATCTFAPEENEQQVAAFLHANGGWRLLEIPWHAGFAPGRVDWCPGGPPELARTVRLWPHRLRGEGHFVAKLGHAGDPEGPPRPAPPGSRPARRRRPVATEPVLDAWQGFAAEALTIPPWPAMAVGERAYAVPDEDLAGRDLRLVRPGLLLGRSRPGRFEPAYGLAMAANPSIARRTRRLDADETTEWLRGEALAADGPPGWTLVTTGEWPLGWGRTVGTVLKNHYPRSLRTMKHGHV